MAIKLYRMTLRRTYARIIIKGETGNEVIYEFANGNPANSTPAKCLLHGEYEQNLLEKSDFFLNGLVKLEKVTETEDEKTQREKAEAERQAAYDALEKVEDVKTVTEAIAYVAEHFDEKTTTARQAKEVAEKNGVTFPNLKLGEK